MLYTMIYIQVVRKFRDGGYNTLVCTCVGEEGLDIGEVDLIICFDAHKSPIRLVQRMGRTGRKRNGRIVTIVAAGKEEQVCLAIYWIASANSNIVLCCTVLYCTTILYCTVLYCTVLYYTVLCCTILYYYTVLYCTIYTLYCIVPYCTVLYCAVLYSTVQYSTVQSQMIYNQ